MEDGAASLDPSVVAASNYLVAVHEHRPNRDPAFRKATPCLGDRRSEELIHLVMMRGRGTA
jgi:hypothetical protein